MRDGTKAGVLGAWLTAALGAPGAAGAAEIDPQVFLGASFVLGFGDGLHPGAAIQASNEWMVGAPQGITAGPWIEVRWLARRGFAFEAGTRLGAMVADRSDCDEWRPVGGFGLDVGAHFGRGGPALRLGGTASGLTALAGGASALTDGHGWREPSVHVGARAPLLPQCWYVIGRPLRVGDDRLAACADGAPDPWLDRAREEHEAVAAFVRLAAELRALSAPPALVAAAERAAREEVGHALASYALAAARTGQPIIVRPLAIPARRLDRRDALGRLAIEALLDGVVGEGAAADRSEAAAGGPARERAIEATIAVEERTHAAIGDRTLGWALREEPTTVRAALRGAERALSG